MADRKLKESKNFERLVVSVLLTAVVAAFVINYLAERVKAQSSKQGEFAVLRGVVMVDHGANDGDSFRMRHAGEEYVFRLYYVDCPEKSSYRYQDRLADQGEYFGGMSESEVVQLGLEAKDYVDYLLKGAEVTVYTRWEPVYDSGRFFAFVEVDGRLLSELLVEKGLARVYTKGVDLPDGKSFKDQREALRGLEATAKSQRLGGWALLGGVE